MFIKYKKKTAEEKLQNLINIWNSLDYKWANKELLDTMERIRYEKKKLYEMYPNELRNIVFETKIYTDGTYKYCFTD
jgi:hypothetical protein